MYSSLLVIVKDTEASEGGGGQTGRMQTWGKYGIL